MASSGDVREPTAERWDETVLGTTAAPWDQPADATAAELRPHEHEGGVHPGWASVPQQSYDDAVSGGWGVPGQSVTGPIPKIRRPSNGQAGPSDEGSCEANGDGPDEGVREGR